MVRLLPIRAYYPDATRVDPSQVASPVYDIMGEDELARYDARPFNAAAFTSRPRAQSVARFVEEAGSHLRKSLDAGAFRQDERPSLYVYGIRYVPPPDILASIPVRSRRKEYLLLGVVGGLDLSDEGEKGVAKHEKTFPDRVEERVRLTEATGMHFAPIMAGYSMPDHAVNNLVEDALGLDRRAQLLDGSEKPLVEATVEGATHRLWRLDDASVVERMEKLLQPVRLLILDGHHRYTASLARRAAGKPDLPLTMLVEGRDRALLLLPWHRLVSSSKVEYASVLAKARQRFAQVEESRVPPETPAITNRLHALRDHGHRGFVIASKEGMASVVGSPSDHEGMDYEMLQTFLEQDLGVTSEETEFLRSPWTTLDGLQRGKDARTAMGFLIPRLSVEGVERTVFELGTVMAQKSTMFLPKVAEGVLFAPADLASVPGSSRAS